MVFGTSGVGSKLIWWLSGEGDAVSDPLPFGAVEGLTLGSSIRSDIIVGLVVTGARVGFAPGRKVGYGVERKGAFVGRAENEGSFAVIGDGEMLAQSRIAAMRVGVMEGISEKSLSGTTCRLFTLSSLSVVMPIPATTAPPATTPTTAAAKVSLTPSESPTTAVAWTADALEVPAPTAYAAWRAA